MGEFASELGRMDTVLPFVVKVLHIAYHLLSTAMKVIVLLVGQRLC